MAHNGWNVYRPKGDGWRLIDIVFYDCDVDADSIRRGLIDHDGYPSDIRVSKGN